MQKQLYHMAESQCPFNKFNLTFASVCQRKLITGLQWPGVASPGEYSCRVLSKLHFLQ